MNEQQVKFLIRYAHHAGYPTLQAFLLSNLTEFMAVAEQWRLMRTFL